MCHNKYTRIYGNAFIQRFDWQNRLFLFVFVFSRCALWRLFLQIRVHSRLTSNMRKCVVTGYTSTQRHTHSANILYINPNWHWFLHMLDASFFNIFVFFCFILFIRNWMTESIDCIDNSMVHVIKSDYIIISVRWICTCRRNDGIWFGFILFVAFVSPPSNTPTYIVMYTSTGRRSHNPQSSWDYWRGNRMDGPHQFVYGSQWFACVGVQFHLKPESPSHTHDNTHCIAVDWKQTENKKREKANK